jgi:hypothetical protein
LAWHGALAVTWAMCGTAAWWQVHRALSGNTLSWIYVFEWPAFAVVAAWFWRVLLTAPARPGPPPTLRLGVADWDRFTASEELAAYNAYLTDLNAGRPARRPPRARP